MYEVSRSWTSRLVRICITRNALADLGQVDLWMFDMGAYLVCDILMHVLVLQVFILHITNDLSVLFC